MAIKQSKKDDTTPIWFLKIKHTCAVLWPFFLITGLVIMVAMFVLLFFKMVGFPWLNTIISVMSFLIIMGYITASCAFWNITTPGWTGLIFGTIVFNGTQYLILFITKINGLADSLQKIKPSEVAPAAGAQDLQPVITFLKNFSTDLINIGLTIAILAVIHLIFIFILHIIRAKGQAKRHAIKYLDLTASDAVRRDYIPKCWQTSRCRPSVRKVCPNYLERTPCWKVRSGCFCQRDLGNYLRETVEDITEDTKTPSAEQMRDKKLAYEKIKTKLKSNKPKWKDQKERCFSCPIYSEHQEYKFRNLQWINFPIAGAIVGILFVPYTIAYNYVFTRIDAVLLQVKIPFIQQTGFANSPFEWVLFAVITVIILSYIMAITEHILLEWQW